MKDNVGNAVPYIMVGGSVYWAVTFIKKTCMHSVSFSTAL